MKNISDEKLEKMLTEYCEADSTQPFQYDPDAKREKIIPFARINRAAVAAAGFVLVSVLSISFYFLFGNKTNTPVAVAPSPESATTPSAQSGKSGGENSQEKNGDSEPNEGPSQISQIISEQFPKPAESTSGTRVSGNRESGMSSSSTTDPATSSTGTRNPRTRTSQSRTSETQNSSGNNTGPTERNNQSTTKPPVNATEKLEQKPTERTASQPTEKPAEQPTEQPHESQPTEPCAPPSNDPEPGYVVPTEGGNASADPVRVYATIDTSLLNGNNDVYCKVYDSSGKLLGNENLYHRSHIADIVVMGKADATIEYVVPEGVITQHGDYTFVFYDHVGRYLTEVQDYC